MKGFAELNHRMGVTGAHRIVAQALSNPIILHFYRLWISPFSGNHYISFLAQAFGPLVKEWNKKLIVIYVRN